MLSRSLQILLIVVVLTKAAADDFDPEYLHSDFMRHFNKTYEE